MKSKINSYGKTWHVWMTGSGDQSGDKLPGGADAGVVFNRDGEAKPGLVERRDERMKISTSRKRSNRADLAPLARPQSGVNALKSAFPQTAKEMPGVIDAGSASR